MSVFFILGTHDFQGCFHPIAYQLTTNEDSESIQAFLKTVDTWVKMLFGVDFLLNVRHTMADQGKAIKSALDALLPHSGRHACWWHINHAILAQVCLLVQIMSFVMERSREHL